MKISLDRADTGALRVDLPGARNEAIAIRATQGLRGIIEQSADRLTLSEVSAESVELEALRLLLGDLVLSSAAGAKLTGLGVALDQSKSGLVFAATMASLTAQDLDIKVDDVHVRGRVKLLSPELAVQGSEGSLAASYVEIADFVLRIGDLELAADSLLGRAVKIAWGAAGFRLTAATLEAPVLRMTTKDVQLAASAVAVSSFALDRAGIAITRAGLEGGQLTLGLRPSSSDAPAPSAAAAPAAEPLIDWRTLDTLSGQLDVDVAVDLTVPIIGRRKATHRLRIAIENGTLDYRALEHNLAKLEDALLDFSVRDGALVLERVNPLFPARGHGKPVVIWDVDATDLALAQTDRVRLSVLPQARLASDTDEKEREPSKSSIALRELGLLRINARLALAAAEPPLATGQLRLRHVGAFVLGGSVFHEPGGSREGSALGELSDLSATVHALALGASRLDAASLTAAAITPIELAFADLKPTNVQLGLSGVTLGGIRLSL
jgi:hypothetical protein